jgi:hypothetical protein
MIVAASRAARAPAGPSGASSDRAARQFRRWDAMRCAMADTVLGAVAARDVAYVNSGSMRIAPQGHSCAQIPQPLQKSRSNA